MFEAWGRIIFRRRRLVLAVAVIAVVLAAIWGTGVFGRLQSAGGFVPPGSQSQQEANLAAKSFGLARGDMVLLFTSSSQTAQSPAYQAAVSTALTRLPRNRVQSAQTYWSTGWPAFVSAKGRVTYALLELAGTGDAAKIKSFDAIKQDFSAPGLTVQAGGQIPAEAAINKEVTSDIGRAEGLPHSARMSRTPAPNGRGRRELPGCACCAPQVAVPR